MTPEQQRAIAIANARRRQAEANGQTAQPQPEGKGFFRAIDDAVRGAADMITFGLADEFAAGMGSFTGIGGMSGEYDANLAAQRERDAQGGGARLVGQIGGALALRATAARSVPGAIGQGALMGGAYGFGSGEGGVEQRLEGAGYGAAIGGAAGGAVRGVANAVGNRAARSTIPSRDELRALGNAAYQAADDAGVIVAPQGVQRLSQEVTEGLTEFGYHPNLQPKVGVVLEELKRLSEGNVTLKGLDLLRRQAQSAASSVDASEKALGRQIISRIDDFVQNLPADEVISGNAQQASQALRQGRDYWSRLRKTEALDGAVTSAERRAASTGTGGNTDNAIRQNVRKLLENRRTSQGLTQAEREAAERVVAGTPLQNFTRLVGRLSPEGNGLMMALGLGGSVAAPAYGVPAMVIGAGAKRLADRATPANVQALSEVIRSGGQTASQIAGRARVGELLIPGVNAAEAGAQRAIPSLSEIAAMLMERVR